MRKASAKNAAPGTSVAGQVRSTMTNPMGGKRPSGAKVGRLGKRSMGRRGR